MKTRSQLSSFFRALRYGDCAPRPYRRPSFRPLLELLEDRTAPADFNLGVLTGRLYFPHEFIPAGDHANPPTNTYKFSVNESVELDIEAFGQGNVPLGTDIADVNIVLRRDGSSDVLASSSNPGENLEFIGKSVSPGTYILTVENEASPLVCSLCNSDLNYQLAISADTARGDSVLSSGTLLGYKGGRDFGALTEAPGVGLVHDFAGYFDGSFHVSGDLLDVYRFSVPATGHVTLSVGGLESDAAGPLLGFHLQGRLLRDIDQDGLFSIASETLATGDMAKPTDSFVFDGNLVPGNYAFVVTSFPGPDGATLGGTNYNLGVFYDVPDSAGATPATARDLGSVISIPTSATEYVSSLDTVDLFKFAISGGGPFILHPTLVVPAGANFDIDVMRDANGNGTLEESEVLRSGTNLSGAEDIFVDTAFAGTYFLRVRRISGEGLFTLLISSRNADAAGNTLAAATNIADPLLGKTHLADFVSSTDAADFYKFTLDQAGTITASFPATAINTDADLVLLDSIGKPVTSSITKGNAGEFLSRSSPAGTYYLVVQRVAGSPAYNVTLGVDTAGSSPNFARFIDISGDISRPTASTIESIGAEDQVDFYKVVVAGPLRLHVFLSLFGQPLMLTVGHDVNNDNVLTGSEILLQNIVSSTVDAHQEVNLTTKDNTFFIEVSSTAKTSTNYGIVFATAPLDKAGNTPTTAKALGVLGASQSFDDFVGDGSLDFNARGDPILGADDVDDFYRFTLGDRGPYAFFASTSALTGNADLQLIRDEDNDPLSTDDDVVLASSSLPGTASDIIIKSLDKPGTYFLRVFRPGNGTTGSASYHLAMQAATNDTAGNTLSTARPFGGLTSTAINYSEFVGVIDRDDFYSFSVPAAGILGFTFNTPTPKVHVEVVQNVDGDNVVDAGEVLFNSANSLTGAPMKLSLPAAGTYFIHVVTTDTDAQYSLALSFSTTTGSFLLTPKNSTVSSQQHVKLSLQWTVPEGSWHVLDDVQLRVRDADSTLVLIKFHEADNTFSLYDPATGTFGPGGVPGTTGVLENADATLFLNTSSIEAAGPTSPSVTLTFDLQFKKPGPSGFFVVEAAATDDLGHVQDFAFAGTLTLQGPQTVADEHRASTGSRNFETTGLHAGGEVADRLTIEEALALLWTDNRDDNAWLINWAALLEQRRS